jgi:transcriptional repressor NrdR
VRCPYCGDDASRVVDTRVASSGGEIRRRRECEECGRRFTTRERAELVLPRVIKRDERREDFSREKLLHGIEHACVKRPIRTDAIERLVDRVERWLQETGEKEVGSRRVGDKVMEELTALDSLAAVRFASVFRNFQSTDEYADFFESVEGADKPPAGDDPPSDPEA